MSLRLIPNVVPVGDFFKAPPYIFFSNNTISQPVVSAPVLIPQVIKPLLALSGPTTGKSTLALLTNLQPPSALEASLLTQTISQPFFTPYNVNQIVWPASEATYFKAPPPPSGFAGWGNDTVYEPLFTPWDENLYNVKPIDPGTYKTVSNVAFSTDTISQPIFAQQTLIPGVRIARFVSPSSTGNSTLALKTTLEQLGQASWLTETIFQPYFTPYDVNQLVWPPSVSTYFKAPPPPSGVASWLIETIAEPYFTPYDVNQLVWPASVSTYFKKPPAPTGTASWLTETISQPFFTPWDENEIGIPPVNVGTYFKAPPAPTGVASWLQNSIAQPFAHKQFIPPWDENQIGIPPVNVGTYFKQLPIPVGTASWLSNTISQPFFTPWDKNWIVWPASETTYAFKPQPPVGESDWLGETVSQPFFIPWDENWVVWPANETTYFKKPPAPTGIASLLTETISQPFFTPWDENEVGISPVNVGTYFKAPPAPVGTASWLANSISQPLLIPYPLSLFNDILFPRLVAVATGKSTVALLTLLDRNPATYVSWLSSTISQPFFTPYNVNHLVWPASTSTYFKKPLPPTGVASWLNSTIGEPLFIPLSTWIFRVDWNFVTSTLIPRTRNSTLALSTTLEATSNLTSGLKITQYVNMGAGRGINGPTSGVATNYQEATEYSARLNSADFDGNVSFYFEAAMFVGTNGQTGYIQLYNHTDSVAVAGSEITTTNNSGFAVRTRSGPIALSGDKIYTIRLKNSSALDGTFCYGARIIVVQTGAITKTQVQIDIGNEIQSASTSNSNIPARMSQWLYQAANYNGTVTIRHDAALGVDSGANTASTAIYDVTGSSIVSGSTLSTSNAIGAPPWNMVYLSSGSITLTDGHVYAPTIYTSAGTVTAATNKLVFTITGSPTLFLSVLEYFTDTGWTNATTTYVNPGDNVASLDTSDFSGTIVTYYNEANLQISDATQTATEQVTPYNNTSGYTGTPVSLTGQTTPNRVRSSTFTPGVAQDIGAMVKSSSSATATLYNAYIVMQVQITQTSDNVAILTNLEGNVGSTVALLTSLSSTAHFSTLALLTTLERNTGTEAPWLTQTIAQPYFTPYDVNQLVWPASEVTYYKALPPPIGVASWLSETISQPFFVPWDENMYVWPASPATYTRSLPIPTGTASWLINTISQPFAQKQFIPPYDINWIVWPASPATYFKAPLPPKPEPWLPTDISQPYFTPYNVNHIVWPASEVTYFKAPVAPTGFASWASNTVSQPFSQKQFIPPWDENIVGIPPVNVGTYYKAPIAPTGVASWLSNTVSQPFSQKQFIPPYDVNQLVWPASVSTYFKAIPAPTGFASWGDDTISQPLFIPVNGGLYLVWLFESGALWPTFRTINIALLTTLVSTALDSTLALKTTLEGTYNNTLALLTILQPSPITNASWLTTTVSQPYFTPFDVNQKVWPANTATYFKKPPAPTGVASWLSSTVSQPFSQKQFIPPYDVNQLVWPANTATYFKKPPAPTGVASWLSETISQPFFTPWDETKVGWPAQYIFSPSFRGIAAWLNDTISQPLFIPLSTWMFRADWNFLASTLIPRIKVKTLALCATLESAKQNSTVALKTTLETAGTKSTIALRTTLEKSAQSTLALKTTLETAGGKSTVGLLTILAKPVVSTLALKTTLELVGIKSTLALKTTLETSVKVSTIALLSSLEGKRVSCLALVTSLVKTKNSTIAIYTILEKSNQSTLALVTNLAHVSSTLALLTLFTYGGNTNIALLTNLAHWIIHRPKQLDKQGAFLNVSTPRGGRSRF